MVYRETNFKIMANYTKIKNSDLYILLESAFNLKAILSEIDDSGRVNRYEILNILTNGNTICEYCGEELSLNDVKENYTNKLDETLDEIMD